MRGRLDRRQSRVVDRRRRQARRAAACCTASDCASSDWVSDCGRRDVQSVADRRVDAERHAVVQPVVDDGRDERPLARRLRLFLHHRRDDQHVVRREVLALRVRRSSWLQFEVNSRAGSGRAAATSACDEVVRRREEKALVRQLLRAEAREPARLRGRCEVPRPRELDGLWCDSCSRDLRHRLTRVAMSRAREPSGKRIRNGFSGGSWSSAARRRRVPRSSPRARVAATSHGAGSRALTSAPGCAPLEAASTKEVLRRRARPPASVPERLLSEVGREALVEELDGDVERRAQRFDEALGLARLLAVLAAQRQRQADDDPLGCSSSRRAATSSARPVLGGRAARRRRAAARACRSDRRPRRPCARSRSRARSPSRERRRDRLLAGRERIARRRRGSCRRPPRGSACRRRRRRCACRARARAASRRARARRATRRS